MKIAHCQFEPWVGDFEHNLARFEEGLKRADAEGAKIVSFPECFFTGYPDTEEFARKGAFAADSPQMKRILDVTARHAAVAIAGFNELRGSDLYNTVVVAHHGQKLGLYSKCAAYMKFHKQGRDFPVWEIDGLKFGVLICADGGYIEPARILALKGARVIFAPHFNYISDKGLISHFMKVRADHAARANENSVYFVRGNNVVLDPAKSGITRSPRHRLRRQLRHGPARRDPRPKPPPPGRLHHRRNRSESQTRHRLGPQQKRLELPRVRAVRGGGDEATRPVSHMNFERAYSSGRKSRSLRVAEAPKNRPQN
jgi:predicted amidohydrolase